MNRILLAIILIVSFSACSDDSEDNPEQGNLFPQTWKLVQMSGRMENSITIGSAMEWQEEYQLRFGNSFTKRRTQNGETKSISGIFIIEVIGSERNITFSYAHESELIGSCKGDNTEQWFFKSEKIAEGAWQQCDGPGLIYNLVE
jgi:hypothetical protein